MRSSSSTRHSRSPRPPWSRSMLWLLIGAAVAGGQRRGMWRRACIPSPISADQQGEYLGGRFLAALVLNATIMLAGQAGMLVGVYAPGSRLD